MASRIWYTRPPGGLGCESSACHVNRHKCYVQKTFVSHAVFTPPEEKDREKELGEFLGLRRTKVLHYRVKWKWGKKRVAWLTQFCGYSEKAFTCACAIMRIPRIAWCFFLLICIKEVSDSEIWKCWYSIRHQPLGEKKSTQVGTVLTILLARGIWMSFPFIAHGWSGPSITWRPLAAAGAFMRRSTRKKIVRRPLVRASKTQTPTWLWSVPRLFVAGRYVRL